MSSSNLLQVRSLQEWPDPPRWMTYSTATQVEACPRQWALQRGDFSEVWDEPGYPPRTNLPILKGRVIHRSIQTILNALRERSPSAHPEAVLERLGGYSAVVEGEIEAVLKEKVAANPRVQEQAADLESDLRESAGKLRIQVQRHIVRLDKIPTPKGRATHDQGKTEEKKSDDSRRGPLPNGVHAEQWVQASSVGWGGYIDLLSLSNDHCEISDIKTGKAEESHADQVGLYALLWWLDGDLNPKGRVADTLRLRYSSETVEVSAPDETQLQALQHQVEERGEEVRALIDESPPPARPEQERCSRCDVRHLCDAYWTEETQSRLASDSAPDFADVELRLTYNTEPGTGIWHAQILSDGHLRRGEDAIFEVRKGTERFQNLDEIRILGAQVLDESGRDRVALRETRYSEVFLLQRA
jgi:CRISPR/Cas system-associated exonuclease Cas4 (RecB family)